MKAEQNKPLIGLDNYTRSPAEEERLNMVFVEAFNTASGKEVLKSLRAITLESVAGGEVSNETLRHLEGQRYLVGLIQRRINKGASQKIIKEQIK
jgi:hypothetical protein|tara:strand:+ start:7123 stop:7407 length:285 start_codon:yes stop_codon:yes gene_type:complete